MLKINLEFRKGILFVRLKGYLTRYTYKCFEDYLIPLIKNHGIKYLVYNLEEVALMDSQGKKSLKKGITAAKKNKGKGGICNAKKVLDNEFKAFENELAAIGELQF